MNIDAKIAKYLMGAEVAGEGRWNDWGEGKHVEKDGWYEGYLQVDCKCSCPNWKNNSKKKDWICGHHKYCLTPVAEYSKNYDCRHVLEALRKLDFVVDIISDTAEGKPHFLVFIGKYEKDYFPHIGEEETLPLALCKAALKALGVKDED